MHVLGNRTSGYTVYSPKTVDQSTKNRYNNTLNRHKL